jgi:6-phosphofructokinase 1
LRGPPVAHAGYGKRHTYTARMRIGILTGGGDCPGLNAVIRAACRRSFRRGHEVVGFLYGWRGVMENIAVDLDREKIRGILDQGGTILRSSGANPVYSDAGPQQVLDTMAAQRLDALIVVGGEGTMRGAQVMWEQHQLPVIGVPKTIDNDLPGTDATVGFDSALQVCTEALDRLHTTAESHNRVMVCEVMGRSAGWLAFYSGIAGGADVILMPELEMTVEEAARIIQRRHDQDERTSSIVVVGEGYELRSETGMFDDLHRTEQLDEYGYPRLGGVSHHVARALEQITGYETRVTILGHVQRGGPPSALDRVLGSRFGYLAADLADRGIFGRMTCLRGSNVTDAPISDSTGEARVVPADRVEFVRSFMG